MHNFLKTTLIGFFCFIGSFAAAQTAPQGLSWIQLEALPSLGAAQSRAAIYDQRFDNVVGFQISRRWHGVALGPFSRGQAEDTLRQLRAAGSIPGDSFIANGTSYRNQFFPADGSLTLPDTGTATTTAALTPVEPVDPATIPDETVREARASERALNRDEKKLLQVALKWANYYTGAIDGAYGPGTRRSMSDWQAGNNHEETGVLTTGQRFELLAAYNAVLDGLGLQTVTDTQAGIEILVPTAILGDVTYDEPFAKYDANGDIKAQLLLISQPGDATRMKAMYDILQTLAIFPEEGDRKVSNRGFEIEAVNSRRHTSAFARLKDGEIKGAVLVWPTGDEERRTRVKAEIFKSFRTVPGVLRDAMFLETGQLPTDLLAGLDFRKPLFVQSGSFVDGVGNVLTSAANLGQCGRIETGEGVVSTIASDNGSVAVLRPKTPQAPLTVPSFQMADLKGPMAVAIGGYSYGGLLGAPTMTFGNLAETKDITGSTDLALLKVDTLAGDIGGPIFDRGGALLGILLPKPDTGSRQFPADVNFAQLWMDMADVFDTAGVTPITTDLAANMDPVDLSALARDVAVLVTCWE